MANDAQLCGSISKVRLDQQRLASADTLADPYETMAHVALVSAHLRRINRSNVGSSDALFPVISALDRVTGRPQLDNAMVAANLRHNLPAILGDLDRIAPLFGCRTDKQAIVGGTAKPLAVSDTLTGQAVDRLKRASPVVIGASVAVVLALIIGAGLAFHWGLRDRTTRLVCRTPLLMSRGAQCTITNILDINRSGMKVEVAPEHAERMWFDLFFCGHNTRGQVKWTNAYFAGIQFKSKISPQMLKDVIAKSRTTLEDSGLASNVTPCFSHGCHETCPRHQATAISEGQHKD
ncbi:hypothetical protein [Aliiroseovarius sp. 2305UL8-7]|uniref:hypothetical protein n=1 Tax=Aliiroseovarius conchicola TaxID=3121637 RepID=UPI003528B8ED